MRYWKEGLLFGACAAACAAPLIFGSAAVGLGAAGLGFLAWGEIGMAAVLFLAVAGFFLLWRQFKAAGPVPADAGCGCAPASGCRTGSACDVPATGPGQGSRVASGAGMLALRQPGLAAARGRSKEQMQT